MEAGLTLGSLFDGIGGFCYAAQLTGRITPIWAAEIEPSCIDITRYRFPEVMHVGSVTELKGDEIQPVDIITFGSPCQDLSIAGQRKGLKGNRSGLFMEAIRIIEEMRLATNGKYPTFIIWENVPGAFSSADGADFRAVLEKVTKTSIPMPASGRWATAGMVRGGEVDAAWRVLDAQFWGVPQRRKRIYLVGDFGGQRAGEILFKSESLLGYHTKSKGERAEVAGESTDSLRAENSGTGGEIIGLDFAHADSVVRTFEDKTPTLLQNMGSAGGQIPCVVHERRTVAGFTYNQGGEGKGLGFEEEKAPTIMTGGRGAVFVEDKVKCLTPWDSQSKRIYDEKGSYPTLQAMSNGGGDQSAVFMEKKSVIPLRDEVTRNKASNGLGVGEVGGPCPTLTTADVHSVFYEAYQHHGYRESSTSGTLTADQNSTIRGDTPLVVRTDKKAFELNQHGGYRETDASGTLRAAGGDYGGGSETIITESHRTKENTPSKPRSIKDILKKAVQRVIYVIRRLTPVECERLQGYPDNWTKYGADGTEIADTARYRAIGNSICVFCAERVYLGILDALTEVSESEREKENIL